jgi:thiamine biosynthesis lipoprotein
MPQVRLAKMAMATRFELVLEGDDEVWLRAAGEEALAEIDRLEAQLSIFRPESDVSRINSRAAHEAVRVEPRLFSLLQTAECIYTRTGGAFDPTVAPLMRAWGFYRGSGRMAAPDDLTEARSVTGMNLVSLDRKSCTVSFERPGVMIDFGGIGKGYAVDEAIAILKEMGVERALLHGGTSTVFGFGVPPWKVAIPYPGTGEDTVRDDVLAVADLDDEALSVSAVWGKSFMSEGTTYGHVLDPRSGKPVHGAVLAACVLPSATESDAVSTALLVVGRDVQHLASEFGSMRLLLLFPRIPTEQFEIIEVGLAPLPSARLANAPVA